MVMKKVLKVHRSFYPLCPILLISSIIVMMPRIVRDLISCRFDLKWWF